MLAALARIGCPCIWKTSSVHSSVLDAEAPLRSTPPNVWRTRWLPQRELLAHPNCRLLVCHGGANSISEALSCGVPVICLPVAWDQHANLEMVRDDLQVGRGIHLAALTAEALHDEMRAVLGDAQIGARAKRLAEEMWAGDSGADGAADLVERVSSFFDAEMRAAAKGAVIAGVHLPAGCDARSVGPTVSDAADDDETVQGWGDGLD